MLLVLPKYEIILMYYINVHVSNNGYFSIAPNIVIVLPTLWYRYAFLYFYDRKTTKEKMQISNEKEAKNIKSNKFTRSNREKFNITTAILEKLSIR